MIYKKILQTRFHRNLGGIFLAIAVVYGAYILCTHYYSSLFTWGYSHTIDRGADDFSEMSSFSLSFLRFFIWHNSLFVGLIMPFPIILISIALHFATRPSLAPVLKPQTEQRLLINTGIIFSFLIFIAGINDFYWIKANSKNFISWPFSLSELPIRTIFFFIISGLGMNFIMKTNKKHIYISASIYFIITCYFIIWPLASKDEWITWNTIPLLIRITTCYIGCILRCKGIYLYKIIFMYLTVHISMYYLLSYISLYFN